MRFLVFLASTLLLTACGTTEVVIVETPVPSTPVVLGENAPERTSPKLVVGLVVDQMRYDYLTRFADDFVEGGFKRFATEGFVCHNNHYSYAPTYTGPGHAAIYTGTTPAVNGVISNNWFDKRTGKTVYCAGDSTVSGVGTSAAGGKMSPHYLRSSTLCEQVELATNGRGKTIGISLKDRGSILPLGGGGDAAYWMIGGDWVTSSWYADALPEWVSAYNANGKVDGWIAGGWDLLLDPEAYDESLPDNNPFEGPYTGQLRPTFPYDLTAAAAQNGGRDIIKATPYGNTVTLDFAKTAVRMAGLGQDEHVDVLAVSCSSTDYVGHRTGPMSREAQDTYLRLDRDLADFFAFLDGEVGAGNYTVFLTADHGAVHVPSHLESLGIATGYWQPGNMVDSLKASMNARYGAGEWIRNYSNEQVFFDHALMDARGVDVRQAEVFAADFMRGFEGVMQVYTGSALREGEFQGDIASRIQRGYHHRLSGDVVVVLEPGWLQYGRTGTSHGSPFSYDTHVPFSLFGAGVTPGETFRETHVRDIAPTVSAILGVQAPTGTTGTVVPEVLGER